MQVTVEEGQGLKRIVKVVVPQEKIDEKVNARVKELQSKLKISGFRPGKVPERVVRRTHGTAIRNEIASQLTQETIFDAIKQVNLNPLTRPQIELFNLVEDGPLEYSASFEVAPEFELAPVDELNFEIAVAEVSSEKIAETLEGLRKQHAEWIEVSRDATKGDRLTIDFEGSIEGKLFEGGAASDFNLELGSSSMIPGFEDALIGCTTGEERNIDVNFPDDYHAAELAGKPTQFKINVKQVCEKLLPEVNEEFVKRFGIESGDVNDLQQQLRDRLQQELDNHLEQIKKDTVFSKLAELNDIMLPQGLVDSEAESLAQQRKAMGERMGIKDMAVDASAFTEQAKVRVKLGLLVNKYAELHSLEADDAMIKNLIQQTAAGYQHPEQLVKWFYEKPERLSEFEARALENKVTEHIISHSKFVEKSVAYDEAMKMKATLLS